MSTIKKIENWEVLTPLGWSNFSGIKSLDKDSYYYFILSDGNSIKCSENHKLKMKNESFLYAKDIVEGDVLYTEEIVLCKNFIEENIKLYDLLDVEFDNEYYSNGIVSHNCAFIDNVEQIFTAAQQTLATGGRCIALSTPNGVGNWFHKEFTRAQNGENKFTPISLPWTVHPERDQTWREEQTQQLGARNAAQECDCSFATSGETVIEPETLKYYDTLIEDPIEKRDVGGVYWLWDYPDPLKSYMVIADVARGDGKDFSTFHVFDIEKLEQVAEYKDQLPTKDFARKLISVATEWNFALLIIENASIGWDVVTTVQENGYHNLYYSPKSEMVGTQIDLYVTKFDSGEGMTPGFSMNQRTRPLVIEKGRSFIEEKSVIIKSQRTLDELRVFVWKNGKPQAMQGYNDDLVIPLFTGLFLRDTALRFRQKAYDLTYASLNSYHKTTSGFEVYSTKPNMQQNPWLMPTKNNEFQDITWLL